MEQVRGESEVCEQNFNSHSNVSNVLFQQGRGSGSDATKTLEIVKSVLQMSSSPSGEVVHI